jgi:hypothetical protein
VFDHVVRAPLLAGGQMKVAEGRVALPPTVGTYVELQVVIVTLFI